MPIVTDPCLWPHPWGLPTGARQYLYINEIYEDTLVRGAPIILQLNPDDYLGTSDDPLGYDRFPIEDHEAIAAYSAAGVPVISGTSHKPKFQFLWNLRLSQDKAATLTSIYDTQQLCWRSLQTDYGVTLIDARLMLQENQPRTRAALTGFEDNLPIPPRGAVYSYGIFSIILKRPGDSGELLNRGFQTETKEGTIEAIELDLLTPESDINILDTNPDTGEGWWNPSEWS